MKRLLLLSFLLPFQLFAQNLNDYIPIRNGNKTPDFFVFNPMQKAIEFAKNQKILEYEDALDYYYNLFQQKQKLLFSGDVYMNDSLTEYANKVFAKIFENNNELKNHIQIYVTSFPSPNAFSLSDGSIFLNLGLFPILNNEAQLAFIIAHEVSHIEKNHSLLALKKNTDIAEKEKNYSNPEASLFMKLKYSRENENEADACALRYLMVSEYNASEASKALECLNHNIFDDFEVEIDYKSIFGIDSVFIDSGYKELNPRHKRSNKFLDKKDYDDLFETHPDVEKRILALMEIIRFTEYNASEKKRNIIKNDFLGIKNLCLFEMVSRLTSDMNYGLSLYLCLQLLQKFPESVYLKENIAMNVYWISYYKEIKSLDQVLILSEMLNSDEYKKFYSFIDNLELKNAKQISYFYLKSQIDNGVKNDNMQYYYALATERLLGLETAKFVYSKYLILFPEGKYLLTVKNKMK